MFDAAFVANLYPTYERLRLAGPLHWVEDFRDGAWLVPRYVDVAEDFRDARLSSRRSHTLTAALALGTTGELDEFNRILSLWMIFLDRPEHSRLRTLLNKSFTPRVVDGLRPRVERIVDRLLSQVAHAGRMEFIPDFAYPLPVEVIAKLLGVPAEDQAPFKRWSHDLPSSSAVVKQHWRRERLGTPSGLARIDDRE